MSYICYVYEGRDHVPYMEVLTVSSASEAADQARSLLRDRPRSTSAELWSGDVMVEAFARSDLQADSRA